MILYSSGLIPTRFLTILSHLTVLILIFFSRKNNLEACMTLEETEDDLKLKDQNLVIGLTTSIILLGVELIGFLSGISMFVPSAAVISIAGHFSGSVALSYFIFDQWDCNLFWWVFFFCSVLPAVVEIIIGIEIVALKKF